MPEHQNSDSSSDETFTKPILAEEVTTMEQRKKNAWKLSETEESVQSDAVFAGCAVWVRVDRDLWMPAVKVDFRSFGMNEPLKKKKLTARPQGQVLIYYPDDHIFVWIPSAKVFNFSNILFDQDAMTLTEVKSQKQKYRKDPVLLPKEHKNLILTAISSVKTYLSAAEENVPKEPPAKRRKIKHVPTQQPEILLAIKVEIEKPTPLEDNMDDIGEMLQQQAETELPPIFPQQIPTHTIQQEEHVQEGEEFGNLEELSLSHSNLKKVKEERNSVKSENSTNLGNTGKTRKTEKMK